MATINSLNDILKEFVVDEIIDQINQEVMALDLFQKQELDWNGRLVHIPIHVTRNTGVDWNATGSLPPAGQQGWEALIVTAQKLYGRGHIDGDAVAALGKGGANSLVNYVQAELDTLKEDVKDDANNATISGGEVIGFLSEQGFLGAAPQDWMFDGDFPKLDALIAAHGNAVCQLVRFSDKFVHATNITITAVDAAAGTVSVLLALDTTNGAGGWNGAAAVPPQNANLTTGDIYAVQIINPAGMLTDVQAEMTGVYSNLGLVSPFGVNAANNASMRANGFTLVAEGLGGAPPNTRIALDLDLHLQRAIDEVYESSGKDMDCFLTGVRQRSRYASLITGTVQADFANRKTVGEAKGGFKTSGGGGLSYGACPIKVTRHIASGHWIGLSKNSWRLAELESIGFMDLDGAILSREAGNDSYEFTVRWYVNLVCVQPNANVIFTGVTV